MDNKDLQDLKPVQEGLSRAKKQLLQYRAALEKIYGTGFLKLRTYAVVSVGYDRLVWKEVGD